MSSKDSVISAVTRRISVRHLDLITKYGIANVLRAIEDLGGQYETMELEEIGSSDVSCWVKDIEEDLARSVKVAS